MAMVASQFKLKSKYLRDDLDCENDYEKPGSESSGVSSWKSWQEADAQFRVILS